MWVAMLWVAVLVGKFCGYEYLWVGVFVGEIIGGWQCLWVAAFVGDSICKLCLSVKIFVGGIFVGDSICGWQYLWGILFVCGSVCWMQCLWVAVCGWRSASGEGGVCICGY